MPRQPRLLLPGIAAHVVQRGNDRGECFRHGTDYFVYLAHLRDVAKEHACLIHAYCLMTNHVHLLLTPATSGSCSAMMRDLGQRYVQYFNRHHRRTGTLWEGRFRSGLVQSQRYVLACHRYIEMNPVRAGMVSTPGDYDWSSHRHYAGTLRQPWLCEHAEFTALGADPDARRRQYMGLFIQESAADLNEIRHATRGGYPLGSDSFKAGLHLPAHRLAARKPGPAAKASSSGSDPEFEFGL